MRRLPAVPAGRWLLCAQLCLSSLAVGAELPGERRAGACGAGRACHPAFEDLLRELEAFSVQRSVSANSTCGSRQPERYRNAEEETETCHASRPELRHPVSSICDRLSRRSSAISLGGSSLALTHAHPDLGSWWQSERGVSPVRIQLSLTHRFLFARTELAFVSRRPDSLVLEASADRGHSWRVWQYLAHDCSLSFPHIPTQPDPGRWDPTLPYCDHNYFAQETSLQGSRARYQRVFYNAAARLGGEYLRNEILYRHFIFTDLRITLTGFGGQASDLQDYYAVADWSVTGQCACFGHAHTCSGQNKAECECDHGTTGAHCQRCLPLLNQQPWAMATPGNGSVCRDCGCAGRAHSCYFDAVKGFGVCQNCSENTTGEKCHLCRPSFYRNPDNTSHCTECNCDGAGVVDDGMCHNVTGQCHCKPSAHGRRCDECQDGFWDLSATDPDGCRECSCTEAGTLPGSYCDKVTGQCQCKANVQGPQCSQCKPGTWNLSAGSESGCEACDCDPGGADTHLCSADTGQCFCRDNIHGRRCDAPQPMFFIPSLDSLHAEAETLTTDASKVIHIAGPVGLALHSGSGVLELGGNDVARANLSVPRSQQYHIVARYLSSNASGLGTLRIKGPDLMCVSELEQEKGTAKTEATLYARLEKSVNPAEAVSFGTVCLTRGSLYSLSLTYKPSVSRVTQPSLLLDTILVLPALEALRAYSSLPTPQRAQAERCLQDRWAPDQRRPGDGQCQRLEFSIMAEVYDGAQECDCDVSGSRSRLCGGAGGRCDCQPLVTGRRCDTCRPFAYGFRSPHGCRGCECQAGGSLSRVCDGHSGQCTCKSKVTGRTCDTCVQGYHGLARASTAGCVVAEGDRLACGDATISSVGCQLRGCCYDKSSGSCYHFGGLGCRPCACDLEFSVDNSCAESGQCACKAGVTGLKCTECEPRRPGSSPRSTACRPCACHQHGSLKQTCGVRSGQCECKQAVTGQRCDQCKPGYYGLGPWSRDGCVLCFCFGHSTNCSSAPGFTLTTVWHQRTVFDPEDLSGRPWKGVDGKGREVAVTELAVLPRFVYQIHSDDPGVFFSAPAEFLGDKRTAYLQHLSFTLSQSHTDSQMMSEVGDVFLEGRLLSVPLVTSLPETPSVNPTEYRVKLEDGVWFLGSVGRGRVASARQLMRVLADISSIKIRAKYSQEPGSWVALHSAAFTLAAPSSPASPPVGIVEQCSCPEEYTGRSCESCAVGYARAPPHKLPQGPFGVCRPCYCHRHSDAACDGETGRCDCQHFTAGDRCQRCRQGFYGDATQGRSDDCQPCFCPGLVGLSPSLNAFATGCVLETDGDTTCVGCAEGHIGRHCQLCDTGYYGDPQNSDQVDGGACRRCQCTNSPALCNRTTGQCTHCAQDTSGFHCEQCRDGYFGLVTAGLDSNCTACDCDPSGSAGWCDGQTGRCPCLRNVAGAKCGGCRSDSYWGFHSSRFPGCQPCACHQPGSVSSTCHPERGQCECLAHAVGQRCGGCRDGFYWDPLQRCTACECDVRGTSSRSVTCDLHTGQCHCIPLVVGQRCDRCQPFGTQGDFPRCRPCPECFVQWNHTLRDLGAELSQLSGELQSVVQRHSENSPQNLSLEVRSVVREWEHAGQSLGKERSASSAFTEMDVSLSKLSAGISRCSGFLEESRRELSSQNETLRQLLPLEPISGLASSHLSRLRGTIDGFRSSVRRHRSQANATAQQTLLHLSRTRSTVSRSRALAAESRALRAAAAGSLSALRSLRQEADGRASGDVARTAQRQVADLDAQLKRLQPGLSLLQGQLHNLTLARAAADSRARTVLLDTNNNLDRALEDLRQVQETRLLVRRSLEQSEESGRAVSALGVLTEETRRELLTHLQRLQQEQRRAESALHGTAALHRLLQETASSPPVALQNILEVVDELTAMSAGDGDGDVTGARTQAEAGLQVAESSLQRSTQTLLAAQGVVSARQEMETQTATVSRELRRVQTTLGHIEPLLVVSQQRARREEELLEIRLRDIGQIEKLVVEVEREAECHTSQRLQLSHLRTHLLNLHQALQHNVQRRRNRSGAMSVAESSAEQEGWITSAALERASQTQRLIEQLAPAQTQLTHSTLQELREVLQVFRKQEEALRSLGETIARLQEEQGHLLASFQQAKPPACN